MRLNFPTTLATTNMEKQREWNEIFPLVAGNDAPLIQRVSEKCNLIEIQSMNPTEIAVVKAIDAWKRYKQPVLVEDVSFSAPEMNNFPGPFYAHVEKALGVQGIHKMLQDNRVTKAVVTITIAFVSPVLVVPGMVCVVRVDQPGSIPGSLLGLEGFGFDPLFIPEGQHVTYAGMSPGKKNECSMRRIAIEALWKGIWETVPIRLSPLGHYMT